MLRVVSLACSSCGAALEIAPDQERFAYGFCGASLVVERRGGTISLRPVVDAIAKVQAGTDKTAAELALARLGRELAASRTAWEASDANLNRANPQGIVIFVGMVIAGSLLAAIIGLMAVLNAPAGEAGGPRDFLIGAVIVAVLSGALLKGLISSHREQRQGLWNQHGPRIAALEAQIAKHRATVE